MDFTLESTIFAYRHQDAGPAAPAEAVLHEALEGGVFLHKQHEARAARGAHVAQPGHVLRYQHACHFYQRMKRKKKLFFNYRIFFYTLKKKLSFYGAILCNVSIEPFYET